MRLRPKTARRLLLLGVLAVFLGVSAAGLLVVRKWQNQRRTENYRVTGMERFEAGNYPETIDNLGRYLRRKPDDADAWLAYATAREKVEESNGSHMVQAAQALQKATTLGKDDPETLLRLAKLYNTIGYHNEARDAATKLRPAELASAKAENLPAMIEELGARIALKEQSDLVDRLSGRMVELDPGSHRGLLLRIGVLNDAGRAREARELVNSRLQAHPDDPRYQLLSVLVPEPGRTEDPENIGLAACRAAGLEEDLDRARVAGGATYRDEDFASQLVSVFDALRRFSHSQLVLLDAAQRLNSTDSLRLFVRRAWASGAMDDVIRETESWNSKELSPYADLAAFRALALLGVGRKDDAATVVAALAEQGRDFRARGWSVFLKSLTGDAPPAEALAAVDAAIKEYPSEPVLIHFRAEALARLGRTNEARTVWTSIRPSTLMGGWVLPSVRRAETLVVEDRLDEAFTCAEEAAAIDPGSGSARFAVVRTQCLMIESGRQVPDPGWALDTLDANLKVMRDSSPRSRAITDLLLPGRAALLATLGREDEAAAQIREVIEAEPPASPDVLRRMALVSVRYRLGLENECLAAAAGEKGSVEVAFTQALVMNSQGNAKGAMELLDAGARGAAPAEQEAWRRARAQFLESVGDDRALEAWKSLAQEYPDSLPVQIAVLQSPSAAADRALIESAVSRVTELGGSDPDKPSVTVRLARARSLVGTAANPRERDEAVSLLRSLAIDVPDVIAVRSLLIDALLLDDAEKQIRPDPVAAIEALRAASAAVSDRAPFTLRLAELLRESGRPQDAAAELSRLAMDQSVTPSARAAAIEGLIEQRELEAANLAMEDAVRRAGVDVPPDLLLRHAQVLSLLRRDREALEVYRTLAGSEQTESGVVTSVAIGLRSLGDAKRADELIAVLERRTPREVPLALNLAVYAERADNPAQALRYLEQATTIDTTDPRPWIAICRIHMGRSEFDKAVDAARRGLAAIPDDQQLNVVLQQALVAGAPEADADITALADALERDPSTRRQAAALRAIHDARRQGNLEQPETLARIARDFADEPVAQVYVLRRLLTARPPAIAQALGIADAASSRFPTNADIADLSVGAYSAAGRWDSMLAAAQRWQQIARTPRADLAVAEAQLALNLPRQATDQVRTISVPDQIGPDDSLAMGVLNVRARGAAMLNDFPGATRLVQPRLASSSRLRFQVAIPLAELAPAPEQAAGWLGVCAQASDGASVEEQVALARAWSNAASRHPARASEFRRTALDTAARISAADPATAAAVLEFRASLHEAAADIPGAVARCREALAADPKSASAANYLARLLLAAGDADGAVQAARMSLAVAPDVPAVRATLAQTLVAKQSRARDAGDSAAAAAAREEAASIISSMAPAAVGNWSLLADLASLAETLGDRDLILNVYEKALRASPPPPEPILAVFQNNAAYSRLQLYPGDAQKATEARELVTAAIRVDPKADYYETLGLIETALGQPAAAQTAYRAALSLSPDALAASAGLADLLSSGSRSEKDEARLLVQRIDAAVAKGARLSPTRSAQVTQAKRNLGSP